jgi:hypothetical protein
MEVDYSEKSYEMYFMVALQNICKNNNYYAPGQCLEHFIGADALAWISNSIGDINVGDTQFSRENLQYLENEMKSSLERIPAGLKFNTFFQFKKPAYLNNPLSKEYHCYNGDYYRFKIYNSQQETLIKISCTLAGLKIIYASPQAKDSNELFQMNQNRKIIDNSCLIKLENTINHGVVTYNLPIIKCHSKPQHIENFDLNSIIKEEKNLRILITLDLLNFQQKCKNTK